MNKMISSISLLTRTLKENCDIGIKGNNLNMQPCEIIHMQMKHPMMITAICGIRTHLLPKTNHCWCYNCYSGNYFITGALSLLLVVFIAVFFDGIRSTNIDIIDSNLLILESN